MPLSLSVFSQSGPPICTPIWAFFRAYKALRALKGPPIKFSHILMHRPYRDILYLKFSCLYLFPFSHKVVPQKASGGSGGGVGGGVVYHTSTGQYSCRKTQSVPPPEKTQGWISLSFMCNCFVFGLILYKCIRVNIRAI